MTPKDIIGQIEKAIYCGDLFYENEPDIRKTYRDYAKMIHPDVCDDPKAEAAFQKMTKLYNEALECLKKGTWEQKNFIDVPSSGRYPYRVCTEFELGKRYVSDNSLIYILNPDKKKYIQNCCHMTDGIHFADIRMLTKYKYRVPNFQKISIDDRALITKKDPREFPMDLFLSAYQKQLDVKDIAWMISRMCDLMCFLGWNNIVLNGMTPENLFINPDQHTIHLYGGWWYSAKEGTKMIGTNKEVFNLMPTSSRTTGIATKVTDMECIRKMFRDICKGKDVPESVEKWLNAGSMNDPISEYGRWNDVLIDAYGTRKFRVFSADADKIYLQN